jgi:YbdK family carboxylate-amine ligase
VGVEEEFLVVDLESRRLTPLAQAMLDRLPTEGFAAELQRSVVETNSTPCDDLMGVRAELVRLRGALTSAAEPLGVGVIASGTTPLAGMDGFTITPGERYQYLSDSYQFLAQEQLICGAQVHVEIGDRDVAVLAVQRVEPYLPALLALSASSPYWQDTDSGYASSRALAWQRWPWSPPASSRTSAWSTSTSGSAPTSRRSSCGSVTRVRWWTTSCCSQGCSVRWSSGRAWPWRRGSPRPVRAAWRSCGQRTGGRRARVSKATCCRR